MDDYQAAFGRHVRAMRMQRGATQEDVAYRAGVHVTYLSGIERGIRNPSLKNIRALAEALEASTAELFAFEAEKGAERGQGY
ncbi:MAG: helix-turn-helix transcriptional regulator [Chloroflexota bacterium]|nr:helix-turn-helix transcriptional regulator [Dehalococcoidia bacterium]MDE2899987.1 helix-turn-helix transcriptional regulator [Chloroflexota bacterium]